MSGLGFIAVEAPRKCELCGHEAECRPYGPKGEQVCFSCGMKDESAAHKAFLKHVFGIEGEA